MIEEEHQMANRCRSVKQIQVTLHAQIFRSALLCLLRWLVNRLVICRMRFRDTREGLVSLCFTQSGAGYA